MSDEWIESEGVNRTKPDDPTFSPPPSQTPPSGTPPRFGPETSQSSNKIIGNQFEVIRRLGEGGMGVVYEVVDRVANQRMALKVIRPELAHREEVAQSLIREVNLSRRLRHDNIVGVYDIREVDGALLYTMELVEGVSLRDLINAYRTVPAPFAVQLLMQLCDTLAYAHTVTIHRDLSPDNIMLDRNLCVRVLDFGIAAPVAGQAIAGAGSSAGKMYYTSPEVRKGSTNATPADDIYSLGVILYEILTGDVPTAYKQVDTKHDKVPRVLAAVIKKAIGPEKQRYQSAAEMKSDLQKKAGKIAAKFRRQSTVFQRDDGNVLSSIMQQIVVSDGAGSATTDKTPVKREKKPRASFPWIRVAVLLILIGLAVGAVAVAFGEQGWRDRINGVIAVLTEGTPETDTTDLAEQSSGASGAADEDSSETSSDAENETEDDEGEDSNPTSSDNDDDSDGEQLSGLDIPDDYTNSGITQPSPTQSTPTPAPTRTITERAQQIIGTKGLNGSRWSGSGRGDRSMYVYFRRRSVSITFSDLSSPVNGTWTHTDDSVKMELNDGTVLEGTLVGAEIFGRAWDKARPTDRWDWSIVMQL